MKRLAVGLAVAALFVACGTSDSTVTTTATTSGAGNPTSTTGPSTSTSTTTPTSTTQSTVAPTTTLPATSTTTVQSSTTTELACQTFGDTSEVRVDFPEGLSPLVGNDIRTGSHQCWERVVIELQPSDIPTPSRFPGYYVRYATEPVTESPSDAPVTIRGSEVLLVSMGSWMNFMGTAGYAGPNQIFPTNVSHVEELRLLENFEGMTTWGIGLDAKRNFDVYALKDPSRLVIDIQTAD